MAQNFFQKEVMASEQNNAYLASVKYYVSSTPTAATQGMLVTVTNTPVTNIWGTSDLSTYQANKPSADTDPIHILDILETPYASIGTTNYRVGHKLDNITAEADVAVRARKPKLDDRYLIGADNFVSAPTVGQYAIPTANDTRYTPSASISTTKHCVVIIAAVTVGFGVESSVSAYRVKVVTEI